VKRSLLAVILGVLGLAPGVFADIPDYMLNVNGTTYCPPLPQPGSPGLCGSFGGLGAVPGLSSTLDTSYPGGTGLGTVSLTYNPGPGSYYVNLWLFENLFPPTAQNEYGAAFGSLPGNESWQIDVPDSTYVGELTTPGAGTIVANTAANALANTNYVPGQSPDDNFQCSADPTCNDYTSMALGLSFTLGAGEQELLNFTVSKTAPASGFYLEQVAPVDSANSAEIDYFYSATAITIPAGPPPTVPEPGSWVLLGTVAAFLALAARRRRAAA